MILDFVKSAINIDLTIPDFDEELLLLINVAAQELALHGISEFEGVEIDQTTPWPDLTRVETVRQLIRAYFIVSVKTIFDPTASATISAIQKDFLAKMEAKILIETDDYEVVFPDEEV